MSSIRNIFRIIFSFFVLVGIIGLGQGDSVTFGIIFLVIGLFGLIALEILWIKLKNYNALEKKYNSTIEQLNTRKTVIEKPKLYFKKEFLTKIEQYFFGILNKGFGEDYFVIPQVNLATIINKAKSFKYEYQNELYRNIDFALINKNTLLPDLLIEINDKTHNETSRIKRDIKVKNICEEANIKLINFYTDKPNEELYIINRLKNELKKDS